MKKLILSTVALLAFGFAASAQNYMVVNSEKIFKSIPAYDEALSTLDKLGEQYQQQIDDAFAEVEKMYNDYQSQKAYLSQTTRQQREDEIINRENEINKFQEQVFGQEGDLMKRRVELIKPIQDKVFDTVNKYAQNNKFELVLDIAANPSILYYAPSADKTEEIIKLLR